MSRVLWHAGSSGSVAVAWRLVLARPVRPSLGPDRVSADARCLGVIRALAVRGRVRRAGAGRKPRRAHPLAVKAPVSRLLSQGVAVSSSRLGAGLDPLMPPGNALDAHVSESSVQLPLLPPPPPLGQRVLPPPCLANEAGGGAEAVAAAEVAEGMMALGRGGGCSGR